MGWPVIVTPQADEDLQEIEAWIGRKSRQDAVRFCRLLAEKTHALGDFPQIGRVMPELGDPAVREIVYQSYRIIYELRVNPDRIFVLRFWHAARGTPQPFG
jgi:toxin ParE1/3/4